MKNFFPILICASFLFSFSVAGAGENWNYLGGKGGNRGIASSGKALETDIAVSGSGAVYVAYQDKPNSRKARVRKFDGANWSDLADAGHRNGLVSEREGVKPSLAVKGEEVFVAFSDSVSGKKIRVKKWDGSSWSDLADAEHPQGFISVLAGYEPEIEFDRSQNYLYAAFQDEAGGQKLKVMRWNGNAWADVSDANHPAGLVSDDLGAEVTLAASKTDESIYLAFEDSPRGQRIRAKKFDGASWSDVSDANHPLGLVSDVSGFSPSIATDSNGGVYVVYTHPREGPTYLAYWDGLQWSNAMGSIVIGGKSIESTVAVDERNNVYVAFSQKKKSAWRVRMKKWNGSFWADAADRSHRSGFLNGGKGKGDPSLAPLGTKIYVSFTDSSKKNKARVMYYYSE